MLNFKQFMNEAIKVTLSHNPEAKGATISHKHTPNEPVKDLPLHKIVSTFEGDDKTDPKTASKESIKKVESVKNGISKGHKIEPILVRKYKDGYQVIDGHHRYQAHKDLKKDSIRAIIIKKHHIKELDKEEDFQ